LEALGLTCRFTIIIVFAASAFSKTRSLAALRAFTASTEAMTALGHRAAEVVACVVAGCEVAVVVLIAIPWQAEGRGGFTLALLLLVAFEATIAATIRRGVTVSCRCFGTSDSAVGWKEAGRNVLLISLATGGLLTVPHAIPNLIAADWAIAVCVAVASAAVLVNFDDLTWLLGDARLGGATASSSGGLR
jgi:hypothetical protein